MDHGGEARRNKEGASRQDAEVAGRRQGAQLEIHAGEKIAVGVLTRGVEPPRVSPYGPEPYASAIPPRERERLLTCAGSGIAQAIPAGEGRRGGAGRYEERRFFRARSSSWLAWRALPNERSRSA